MQHDELLIPTKDGRGLPVKTLAQNVVEFGGNWDWRKPIRKQLKRMGLKKLMYKDCGVLPAIYDVHCFQDGFSEWSMEFMVEHEDGQRIWVAAERFEHLNQYED